MKYPKEYIEEIKNRLKVSSVVGFFLSIFVPLYNKIKNQ